MAILHQNIPDPLLSEFNDKARKKFGDKKGSKHSAVIEALQDWVKSQRK